MNLDKKLIQIHLSISAIYFLLLSFLRNKRTHNVQNIIFSNKSNDLDLEKT
jgi:hypothetical protein